MTPTSQAITDANQQILIAPWAGTNNYALPDDEDIDYPDEDDQGMPEGDWQREYISYSTKALRHFFRQRPDVYVSGNLFIYYEKGNPAAAITPDTFVIFGVNNHDRPSYKVWQEGGKLPSFALEVVSKSTKGKDLNINPALYAQLGVDEYFQYDPNGNYIQPRLQGLRLVNGDYQPIPANNPADGVLSLTSEVLGLELRLLAIGLRFYNPAMDRLLLDYEEEADARQLLETQVQQERQQRQQLITQLQSLSEEQLRAIGIDPTLLR